jgi:alpha-beta hydrolase superfamily lysophospholipase
MTAHNKLEWKKINERESIAHFLSAQDNQFIYLKKWNAKIANDHEKIIFLFHDLCQYHGRFESLVKWYQEHNPEITFVAMDFVGHGLSSGTRGHFDDFDFLVKDLFYLLDNEDKGIDQRWFLLAHGLGSLVLLDLLNQYPSKFMKKIDGLILSNFVFNFKEGLVLKWFNRSFFKFGARVRLQKFFQGNEITSDPAEAIIFEKDSLIVHRPTKGALDAIKRKSSRVYRDAYFLDWPILLLNSKNDKHQLFNGMEYFLLGIKKNLLTEKNYSNLKHDLYNEKDKNIVFNDILEWINTYENFF